MMRFGNVSSDQSSFYYIEFLSIIVTAVSVMVPGIRLQKLSPVFSITCRLASFPRLVAVNGVLIPKFDVIIASWARLHLHVVVLIERVRLNHQLGFVSVVLVIGGVDSPLVVLVIKVHVASQVVPSQLVISNEF